MKDKHDPESRITGYIGTVLLLKLPPNIAMVAKDG
jgi:hypothetical protein